jgi:hypothetical protein
VPWLAQVYRLDRTEGQPWQVWLGMEKTTLVAQVRSWFGDLGLPVVAVRGYGSQSYLDAITARAAADDRPAVLIYAGDLDPSGEDIGRDFLARTAVWNEVHRVVVNDADVSRFALVKQDGNEQDTRARRFKAKHGDLYQVEVEAMDPSDLRAAFQDVLDRYWTPEAYELVIAREAEHRARLADLADEEQARLDAIIEQLNDE